MQLSQRLAALSARNHVRADIVWSRVAYDVVAVVDCNMGGVSVTNDVDNVLEFLLAAGHMRQSDRLIYRDTTGDWDQIVHQGGVFKSFRCLRARSVKTALERL